MYMVLSFRKNVAKDKPVAEMPVYKKIAQRKTIIKELEMTKNRGISGKVVMKPSKPKRRMREEPFPYLSAAAHY